MFYVLEIYDCDMINNNLICSLCLIVYVFILVFGEYFFYDLIFVGINRICKINCICIFLNSDVYVIII